MDQAFIDDLIATPAPLWTCDGGIIEPLSSGPGFEIQNTSAGEFLYEMGFRNGDIPLDINGLPLGNYQQAINAFQQISFWETLEFSIRVQRPTHIETLNYEVVP